MEKHFKIPAVDGLYWYAESGQAELQPVLVNQEKWGGKVKFFNGALQGWLRDGEYLLGPQPAPKV